MAVSVRTPSGHPNLGVRTCGHGEIAVDVQVCPVDVVVDVVIGEAFNSSPFSLPVALAALHEAQ